MASTFGTWWQKIKQHWVTIVLIAIIFVVVIVLIVAGYKIDWTGFNGYNKVIMANITHGQNAGTVTRTEEYQPGKALWDWLQLLIIPFVLAGAVLLFNVATIRTEQKIARERYENDKNLARDKQREDLLQIYLDRMSELLLEKSLRTSPSEEIRNVARVRTITILFQLDARRIGYVFAFLRESGLMSLKTNDSIVSLKGANLNGADFTEAYLEDVNLSGANFIGADLGWAFLDRANLSGANLNEAGLYKALLSEADLSNANLWRADLSGADLSGADLSGADLGEADLSGANLSGVKLNGASLSHADLKGAIGITDEELGKQAKSLEGTTMPSGLKYP